MAGELGADPLGALPLGYVGDTTLPIPDIPPPVITPPVIPPTVPPGTPTPDPLPEPEIVYEGLTGLSLTGFNSRGIVRVAGEVPNGRITVQRRAAGMATYTLRSGSNIPITAEGLLMEDSEAPIGQELTYVGTSTPNDRIAQRNLVHSPDFSRGQQGWTPGTGRTLTVSGGVGNLSRNTSGTGVSGQTIAEVALGTLEPSTTYLVTGRLSFTTPDIFTWQEIRDLGTWANVRAARANWAAVMSNNLTAGDGIYTQVLISFASGAAAVGATITALSVPVVKNGTWFNFAAYLTTPATVPDGTRLRMLHGSSVREKAVDWKLDKFSVQKKTITDHSYKLDWFSGDSAVPDRAVDYMMHNPLWEDVSGDSDISWEGAVGNSVSRFIGPSKITTTAKITLEAPDVTEVCGPVLLSDPVNSSLGQWFGLGDVDDLSYAANLTLMQVLNRPDYIASSTARSGPRGGLSLYTKTLAERAFAIKLLQTGRVLYLRNADVAYPENNWYIAVGDVVESRMLPDARRPERVWTFDYTKIERPSGLIEASTGITWKQIKDAKLTWAQLRDNREDWLDVLVQTP